MPLEVMPKDFSGLKKIAIATVIFYLAICGALFMAQRGMIYFPDRSKSDLTQAGARSFTVQTKDGLTLTGWYIDPAPGRPVGVLFQGNAANMGAREFKMPPFIQKGMGYLFAEYRGYGGNPGKPHEQGLYHDARAYLDWLQKSEGKKPSDIILVGESLGTGVALKMAEENPGVRAVILETPYTSLPAVAQKYYPFFPAHLIVRDKYNNLSRIGAVTAPILILHGRMDEIIPYDHAVKLKEEAGDNATLVTFDKGMHNDLYYRGAQKVIGDFLATLMTTPKT